MSSNLPVLLSNKHQISSLDPKELKPLGRTTRKHSKLQLEELDASERAYDYMGPIVVTGDNKIIDGEARVARALQRGERINGIVLRDLTLDQARGLRIAINKNPERATWDDATLAQEVAELIANGLEAAALSFQTPELDILFSHLAMEEKEDGVGGAGERPHAVSREDDLWILGEHRLACGNSRAAAVINRLVGGRKVGACFTDPPYNKPNEGHTGGKGKFKHEEFPEAFGEMSSPEFQVFLEEALSQIKAVLRPGRLAYVCMDSQGSHLLTNAADKVGLKHKTTCVWVKSNGGMGSLYRVQHEFIHVYQSPGEAGVNNVQLGKFGRNRTTVWQYIGANSFGATRDDDLGMHPTVKPTDMVEDAIKDCTHRNEYVLDPFGGSGTTMIAAQKAGRRALLCELKPEYVDLIIRRYTAMFGGTAIHEETGLSFNELEQQRAEEQPSTGRKGRKRTPIEPSMPDEAA